MKNTEYPMPCDKQSPCTFRLRATGSAKVRRTCTSTTATGLQHFESPASVSHRLQENEDMNAKVRLHCCTVLIETLLPTLDCRRVLCWETSQPPPGVRVMKNMSKRCDAGTRSKEVCQPCGANAHISWGGFQHDCIGAV